MNSTRFQKSLKVGAKEKSSADGLANAGRSTARRAAADTCATPARPPRVPGAKRGPATLISAKIDVGFGNALFIRGSGAGLSWDRGQPLNCVESSTWVWSTHNRAEEITFKLLVNDQLWCRGENLSALPGIPAEVVPLF